MADDAEIRNKMKSYWQVHKPSLESMMLSDQAVYLAENEQNEIISYMPNYRGKKVLELGAGIGRFTSRLAVVAGHVTAVDFMESYIQENKNDNGHLGNIDFKTADVTKLNYPPGSFDIVFSNWLLMYLTDAEVEALMGRVLSWLKPGGYFFMRESCYHQSGNKKRDENPTYYRTPLHYSQMLQRQYDAVADTNFKIVKGKNIITYIQYHGNPNQLCFVAQSAECPKESKVVVSHQERQYTIERIKQYERIYGHNYICTGGEQTTRDFVSRLGLSPGKRVLDVGCGTGGSAFFMARHYGVHVHGIDLSTNMIHLAIERDGKQEIEIKKKLQFEITDVLETCYDESSYDIIYCRDAVLHIHDKEILFQKFYRWLKPGGKIFMTDYCLGKSPSSDEFKAYMFTRRGYSLQSIASSRSALEKAGFKKVVAEDRSQQLITIHKQEVETFIPTEEAFVAEFSRREFNDLIKTWKDFTHWTEDGQMAWGCYTATK